jgi:hypothetical protein
VQEAEEVVYIAHQGVVEQKGWRVVEIGQAVGQYLSWRLGPTSRGCVGRCFSFSFDLEHDRQCKVTYLKLPSTFT